jgi:hypothetical protein
MTHLSNDEILTAVEGDSVHTAHLSACESCRNRVNELRQVLTLTRDVEIPEPSPLFWNHFSERVREAVAAEPLPRVSNWRLGFGWTASVAGVLAIMVIGVVVTLWSGKPAVMVIPPPAVAESAILSVDPLDDDPTWVLMGEIASQIEWEDASEAGLIARPGSAEQALGQMSEEEQRLVVELLQQELERSKSL